MYGQALFICTFSHKIKYYNSKVDCICDTLNVFNEYDLNK